MSRAEQGDKRRSRREALQAARGAAAAAALAISLPTAATGQGPATRTAVFKTGSERLFADNFAALKSLRIGLITNHTGRAGDAHLADLMAAAPGVKLAAILAPEHGFRGAVEAGARVANERDPATGVSVLSLYGAAKKPTPAMLSSLDVLVFDIQDIGVRFYTYISTMGLAMQAAAQARIPFIVLDRPNPLGGAYVSGFVLEPIYRSFVGQYQIPIVHGMTVGELAQMIKGEALLDGLKGLDLQIVKVEGWRRQMRWPALNRSWVATSPNIPSYESALVYPGIGVVGELEVSEGRGTLTPFQIFGAPWLDAASLAAKLNVLQLPGVAFEVTQLRPKSIPGVAASPRFAKRSFTGLHIRITDVDAVAPLELGMHVLGLIAAEARAKRIQPLYANKRMFDQIAGTSRLRSLLDQGAGGSEIIGTWQKEAGTFRQRRQPYLLY